MRKSLLALFSVLFSISIYATDIPIGWDETGVNSLSLPISLNNVAYYSISQQIYLASELGSGASKKITKITFAYVGTESLTRDLEVYLMETNISSFTSTSFVANASGEAGTLVYDDEVSITASTDLTITFTTPFVWSGTKNLILTVNDKTGVRAASNRFHIYETSADGGDRFLFKRCNSSSFSEITGWSMSAVGSITADANSNRKYVNKIKFTVEDPIPAPTSPNATSISSSSATLNWTAAEGADSYEVRYGTTSGSLGDAINVGNVTSYFISGLDASTRYYYQIRTKKGSDYSAWTTEVYFNTLAHEHYSITFSKWNQSNLLPTLAGNYYLAHNVTLSDNWTPSGSINLCLNGKTVSMGANYGLIDDNITVAIYDEEGGGKITSSNSSQTLLASGSLTKLFVYANIENTGSGRKIKAASGATASIDDPIDLSDAVDNASVIAENEGLLVKVNMTRSLTSSQYNTFCLPFALGNGQLEEYFGEDYDLEEFVGSSFDGEELSLTFNKVTALEAGKPYLLQPSVDVSNPSFEGVTIGATSPADQTSDTYISFHGTFAPTELTGGNKNLLFLGADNELFWPESTGNINGFRAYFEVKSTAAKAAKRARIVKQSNTVTGIESQQLKANSQKLIKNGHLLILRDNKTYNVLGIECK